MKKNINTSSLEELIQIKGIGKTIAERILAARKKGTFITSMEDLQTVGKINSRFLKDIEKVISFGKTKSTFLPKKSKTSTPQKIKKTTSKPLAIKIPRNDELYNFKVNIDGLIPKEGRNPFAHYKLSVHYTIANPNGNTIKNELKFPVQSYKSVNVSMIKPSPDIGFLLNTFHLVLVSEGKDVVYDAVHKTEDNGEFPIQINTVEEALNFNIQLIADATPTHNPYANHLLEITYDAKNSLDKNVIQKKKESFAINAEGKATVKLNHQGDVEKLYLQVKAPAGEIIGHKTIDYIEIENDRTIEIQVPPRLLADAEGLNTLPDRPKKMVGRVIDGLGKKDMKKVQVVIFASQKEEPVNEDFYPLQVVETETNGYFSMDTPIGFFTKAYAMIGVKGITNNPIEIRLETDTIITQDDGEPVYEEKLFFPANLILIAELETSEEDEHDDCGCNDCSDLDFHQPKKVLEEFSFYTVVRTTEPNIQGLTLEDDEEEMSVQEIIDIVPIFENNGTRVTAVLGNDILQKSIKKNVLRKFMNAKKGLTFTTLLKALNQSNALKLKQVVQS
ncbi:MAG: ComEA family DNA-binding protein, partial [Saprospiraceae bacterium]